MKPATNYTLFFNNSWLEANHIDHVFMDHTVDFGNGVSKELRSYEFDGEAHIFKAKEHFEQLILAADTKQIKLDVSIEKLVRISYQLLEKNQLRNATIHPLIYTRDGESKLIISVKNATPFAIKENVSLTLTSNSTSEISLKTNAYGEVVCNGANPFFFMKDGILYTPSPDKLNPASVLRNSIIECAITLGYPVLEKSISTEEIRESEVAFFSNNTHAINIIDQVDHHTITEDWRETAVFDLLMMFRKQLTNQAFRNHSII